MENVGQMFDIRQLRRRYYSCSWATKTTESEKAHTLQVIAKKALWGFPGRDGKCLLISFPDAENFRGLAFKFDVMARCIFSRTTQNYPLPTEHQHLSANFLCSYILLARLGHGAVYYLENKCLITNSEDKLY